MKYTLSLSLIVKNEEIHMDRVLRNASLYADEIIIVDTGSTDRTKEIAKQYTKHVYDFVWSDDFSAARNFGLRHCTKEFIMWLDTDDVILDEDAMKIKELFEKNSLVDIYFLPYHYGFSHIKDQKGSIILNRERIFRNHKNIFFTYPIHEYLDITGDISSLSIAHADVPIYHRNIDSFYDSPQRNLAIANRSVKKNEYKNDMRMWWYLENAYRGVYKNELALEACYTAIAKNDENMLPQQKSNLYLDLGVLLIEKKMFSEAEKYLQRSIDLYPHWREPFFIYAKLKIQLKKYSEALDLLLQCKRITFSHTRDVFNKELYTEKLLNKLLAKVYSKLGKIDSAAFYFFNSF